MSPDRLAAAGGLNQTDRQVGGALGVAALAALLDGRTGPGAGVEAYADVYLFCTIATLRRRAGGAPARPRGEDSMTTEHCTDVLAPADLAALLHGARWRRLAVLGDSVAEGVGEPHPGYRNLSWVDRIAEALQAVTPGLEVMNLGERNLLASEVRERQLVPALTFGPDLAIVAAGGNDALRRSFDRGAVERELDLTVAHLRRGGADVLMIELMDIVASGLVPEAHGTSLHERFGALAAVTRTVARRHGAMLVPMRHHPASADPGVYASDRLHLNARGHAIVATESVRVLSAAIERRAAA